MSNRAHRRKAARGIGVSANVIEPGWNGDQHAAEELVHRYTERLLALVRSRLSAKLSGRIDAEDVVQSAFRSFFRVNASANQTGRLGDDLWHLLAAITVRKVHRQVERHVDAERRSVDRESPISVMANLSPDILARGPSPEEEAIVIDELRHAMTRMLPLHRQMVELTLQGYSSAQVAALTKRSERLVRLVLEKFRDQLQGSMSSLSAG